MAYAQRGVALLKELQRSAALPSFNEEVLRATVTEMLQLDSLIVQALTEANNDPEGIQERPGFATKVLVYHTSVQRNKRVALTYLVERLARLQTLAWEMGYVPERVKPNLVVAENEYFAQYCSLIHGYSRQFGAAVNIDLTESTKPPSDVSIEVRVLKEIGAIFTEEGMVQLSLGRMLSMRRSDAEPLVRSGKLEHVLME